MAEKRRVLIVEDNEDHGLLLSILLRRNHYDVLVAETAEKARQVLAAHGPERIGAILLDLMLPAGEDGLSLARALRRQDDWKRVPIIAVTALLYDSERVNVFEAGCDAHVVKPVSTNALLAILSLYISGQKETDALRWALG